MNELTLNTTGVKEIELFSNLDPREVYNATKKRKSLKKYLEENGPIIYNVIGYKLDNTEFKNNDGEYIPSMTLLYRDKDNKETSSILSTAITFIRDVINIFSFFNTNSSGDRKALVNIEVNQSTSNNGKTYYNLLIK